MTNPTAFWPDLIPSVRALISTACRLFLSWLNVGSAGQLMKNSRVMVALACVTAQHQALVSSSVFLGLSDKASLNVL